MKSKNNSASKVLVAKWEARLAKEGMPGEPVRKRRSNSTYHYFNHEPHLLADSDRLTYWTTITHAVNALPESYPRRDKAFLLAYVETGYLLQACVTLRIQRGTGRGILKRFATYSYNQQCPEVEREYQRRQTSPTDPGHHRSHDEIRGLVQA